MNYQDAIDYLHNRLASYERQGNVPNAYKPGLTRILALCEALGHPQKACPMIHIAGTNGKGSTASLLSAILQSAGYNVGLHTSPHLTSFTERARINGSPMPDNSLPAFIQQNMDLIETIQPSYFELGVAYALHSFAQQNTDIAIIEVGLGGTFDATNIITPILSIITTIGADHLHILGPSAQDVARNKAGIIKPNVPCIISRHQADIASVFTDIATQQHAPLSFADHAYTVEHTGVSNTGVHYRITHQDHVIYDDLICQLRGDYQIHNIPGVLSAVDHLRARGYSISSDAVRQGFAQVCDLSQFKGRWQVIQRDPLVIADGAHNPDGLRVVQDQISRIPHKNLYAILGYNKEKDPAQLIAGWPRSTQFIFAQAPVSRATPADTLTDTAMAAGYNAITIPDVNDALDHALALAEQDDLIFIGGSLYLLADLKRL